VLLLITAMFAIGLLVTAVARTAAVASGLSWALFMPLAFFGGILMSLEFMPAALRTISD
jgi:ABC-2 type transport system permease protein